jgi:hypothetical protein
MNKIPKKNLDIQQILDKIKTLPIDDTDKATILEEIKRTGLLRIAVREDAVPFGYRDLNENWTGICIDFLEILRNQVRRELDQPIILIKLFKSTLFNRFDLVNDKVVALECGPNTIRDNLSYNIDFSDPFFLFLFGIGRSYLTELPFYFLGQVHVAQQC